MKRGEHPCCECGKPTDLRGWVYTASGPTLRMRREYRWWCRTHFIKWMFNLYPYECTVACRNDRERATGFRLDDDDVLTWVQLEAVLGVPEAMSPKCPWCGDPMRSMGAS